MFNITLSKGPRIWFSNIRQHFHPYFLNFAIYERRVKWRVNKITSGEVEQEFISKSNFYKIQINVCIVSEWLSLTAFLEQRTARSNVCIAIN